jgi:hypothetical protein
MKLIVFTGPTLPARDARPHLDAEYRPPAAIGDVYKAALARPFAIGIIDGYYETTPSIWHKEVLWALTQGIHVYGAASMGALRAAELAAFGMAGVGKVFEAYRDGLIEDDDEVAVLHGPEEMGYLQITEATVNMRATLSRAAAEKAVDPGTADRLIALARRMFWKERGYERLLADAAQAGIAAATLAKLRAWLPAHKVNQKREDAIAMLGRMAADAAKSDGPKRPDFDFQHTVAWDAILHRFAGIDDGGSVIDREELLDELRLTPGAYADVRRKALSRTLASQPEPGEFKPTTAQLQSALRDFRRSKGFDSPAALDQWMKEAGLSREDFLRLMAEDAQLASLEASLAGAVSRALLEELRQNGSFARLLSRARDKCAALSEAGLADAGVGDTGLDEGALTAWFREQAGVARPADTGDLALSLGFQTRTDFVRALAREYCFRQQRKA